MAILVDDMVLWQVTGQQPTGIQRVVLDLLDTAYERRDIRAWPAVSIVDTGGSGIPRIVETSRSLGQDPAGRRGRRLQALRFVRTAIALLPIPARLRLTAQATYARLALASVGTPRHQVDGAEVNEIPSLLVIPGMFWHANTATRARRLAVEGLTVRMIVHDLFPILNPEWYPPAKGQEFREALDQLVEVCDRVVTLSDEVAHQVVVRYPELTGRVRVGVPKLFAHGPKTSTGRGPVSAPVSGPFLLALSTVEPRKNHRVILDAWDRVRQHPHAGRAQLVIAGRRGWMADDIEAEIAQKQRRLGILRLDHPFDSVVDALYRECVATVHASWAEGFGLPVRESVARGIPTLMSSSIPKDGLPHGTFRTFDPADSGKLAELMIEAVLARPQRVPVARGTGTGWEPVLSALLD